MVNSVSSSSAVSQQHLQSQQAAKPPAKPKDAQQPDTVKLSKPAAKAADADHDGDSR